MTDEQLTLLIAIEQNPDDDGARVAFADLLDYDRYDPRAELIRVQCNLKNLDCITTVGYPPNHICDRAKLWNCVRCLSKIRASELLKQHEAEFRRGPKCEKCNGAGTYEDVEPDLDTDDVVTHTCDQCHGTGDVGGLMQTADHLRGHPGASGGFWLNKVEFVRGFPRVHCRMEECMKRDPCSHCMMAGTQTLFRGPGATNPYTRDCPRCDGDGSRTIPSDWLLSVVRHHRGVEIWVTDVPFMEPGRFEFRLRKNGGILPQAVEDMIYGHDTSSAEVAMTVLARAFPRWARKFIKEKP